MMDYKKFIVLVFAIISFTAVSFGVLWFSPFQDSEVEGEITSTFTIKDVSIPLNDIIDAVTDEIDKQRNKNEVFNLVGDAYSEQPEHIYDLRLGEITSTFEIQLSGKNIEKLVRGIMVSQSPSNSFVMTFSDEQISTILAGGSIITFTLILSELYFRKEAKKESTN